MKIIGIMKQSSSHCAYALVVSCDSRKVSHDDERNLWNRGDEVDQPFCFKFAFLLSIGDEVREVGPAPRCCCDG